MKNNNMNRKFSNKELIENLESKIDVLKSIEKRESDLFKNGRCVGLIEGFEYSIDKIKELPIWIPNIEKIIYVLLGLSFGFILGFCITTINK